MNQATNELGTWSNSEVLVAERSTDRLAPVVQELESGQKHRTSHIDGNVFRQLVENIREVFWVTDISKTQMIYISPGYETIWGRTCESLYKSPQNWLEAVHPDDRERVRGAATSKQASNLYEETYRIVRPDGAVRWIHDRAFLVRKESIEGDRVVGIAEDITQRKLAEEALLNAEANYRSLFENAMEGIFQTTPEGRYLSANPTLVRMLGYANPEELIASISDMSRDLYVRPERRLEFKHRLETEGFVRGFENEVYRKDRSKFWVSINARAVRDACGKIQYYQGTSQDITKRKEVAAQLATLAAIVENAQDAIFSITLDGRFISWNKSAERIYGYSSQEASGRHVAILLSSSCAAKVAGILEDVSRGATIENYETLHVRKDGSPVTVSLTISPVRDDRGNIASASVIARDATQRIQLEKEILETSIGERRRIGHELHDGLGQYLAGIAFRAKVLEQTLAADGVPCAREAKELTALLSNAIGQTRSLARGLDPTEVENRGLIVALQDLAAETEKLFGVRCLFECRVENVQVDGQAGLAFYRIMQESIHNAIKHGGARRIQTELRLRDGYLCLEIQDDGAGFDMGATGSGCGMGLRVMNYRARSIGAMLLVKSQMKQGTLIECRLPISPVHPA
jgi:PAS domain S-box-containing protein